MTSRITALGWLVLGLSVVAGLLFLLVFPRLEGTPPEISTASELAVGVPGRDLTIELHDSGSGLRSVELRLLHPAGTRKILERQFPGGWFRTGIQHPEPVELRLDPRELGVPDGSATLVISARDWSLRHGFQGNRAEVLIPLTVDTRAPRIEVVAGITYVYRGGSAAAVYRVSEAVERDGVEIGEHFFAGYPLGHRESAQADAEKRIALFGVPIDAPTDVQVTVVAVDLAGNESSARFPIRLLERQFSKSSVSLPTRFLDLVVPALARDHGVDATDPVAAFQQINTELRRQNEERIRELSQNSDPEPRWRGAFEQLKNSTVTSRFAEQRTYTVAGQTVSRARHYGFDLASTARAPVTAANNGIVRFAGDLGIYGQSVLLDHGIGLTTLYGHLSSLAVSAGDEVEKGGVLGRSGATGLAGGDHLHFAILVGDTYVDPLEWWDPEWVRSHVEVRMQPDTP